MMLSYEEVLECAKRGAAELDKINPHWWKKIDLDRLRMESCVSCVLGQLYGSYLRAPSQLTERQPGEQWNDEKFGFDIPNAYPEINIAWRQIITERRQQAQEAVNG